MATHILKNNRAGRDNRPPAPPLKEDGSPYEYVYYPANFSYACYADTTTEIIAHIIGNEAYLGMDEEAALAARAEYLSGVATNIRLNIIAKITDEENEALDEWEINELNYHNDLHYAPHGWGENGVDIWNSKIPLVLLDVDYQPFTDVPPVLSGIDGNANKPKNLIWLRAAQELDFLKSLHRIRHIKFGYPTLAIKTRQR